MGEMEEKYGVVVNYVDMGQSQLLILLQNPGDGRG
jgi:hypothetical protein